MFARRTSPASVTFGAVAASRCVYCVVINHCARLLNCRIRRLRDKAALPTRPTAYCPDATSRAANSSHGLTSYVRAAGLCKQTRSGISLPPAASIKWLARIGRMFDITRADFQLPSTSERGVRPRLADRTSDCRHASTDSAAGIRTQPPHIWYAKPTCAVPSSDCDRAFHWQR